MTKFASRQSINADVLDRVQGGAGMIETVDAYGLDGEAAYGSLDFDLPYPEDLGREVALADYAASPDEGPRFERASSHLNEPMMSEEEFAAITDYELSINANRSLGAQGLFLATGLVAKMKPSYVLGFVEGAGGGGRRG